MKQFRIIGIRILEDCDINIRKILKENTTYFFCKGYKVSEISAQFIERIEPSPKKNIYDVEGIDKKTGTPRIVNVSVSAIVGKNGDGKSTLIEIMMRILFRLTKYNNKKDSGLRAILYFEIGQDIYSIECNDNKIRSRKNDTLLKQLKEVRQLCYTLIINYSLYSYNLITDSYLANMVIDLFHDEDLDKIPMLIHPSRDYNDTINIQELLRLTNSRLLAIYSLSKKAREIDNSNIAIGFAYNINNLGPETLSDPLVYLLGIVNDSNDQNKHLKKYSLFNINTNCHYSISYPFIPEHKEQARQVINEIDRLLLSNRDIIKFIDSLDLMIEKPIKDQIQMLSSCYNNEPINSKNAQNTISIEVILLIIVILRAWEYAINDYLVCDLKLNEILQKVQEDNFQLNANESSALFVFSKILLEDTFLNVFYSLLNIDSICNILNSTSIDECEALTSLKEPINKIFMDGTKKERHDFNLSVNFLKKRNNSFFHEKRWSSRYKHFISFDKLYERIKGDKIEVSLNDIADNMPCSKIFEGQVVWGKKSLANNSTNLFESVLMSSGELQLLSAIGSIVFYIRSIDKDIPWTNDSQYRHINLILEEIELYYHPEYQRIFLYMLLQNIQNIELERIESINIIFVTHSPFILSDISQKNILFLKNGLDCGGEISVNPFAANVNEILCQSFFLDKGFMGELAKTKIQSLISFLRNEDTIADEYWDTTTARSFIEEIGEPLLSHNLMELYAQKYSTESDNLITWHEKQIEKLKKQKEDNHTK